MCRVVLNTIVSEDTLCLFSLLLAVPTRPQQLIICALLLPCSAHIALRINCLLVFPLAVPTVSGGGSASIGPDSCMTNLRHQYVSVYVGRAEWDSNELLSVEDGRLPPSRGSGKRLCTFKLPFSILLTLSLCTPVRWARCMIMMYEILLQVFHSFPVGFILAQVS